MMFAHEAYAILGFSPEETYNVYKLTAIVMHMGNLTKDFVPVGKEEQAEIKDETNAEKVAELCGIDREWMVTYFCKPKLKVGTEWVSKGSTCDGASSSVGGIGRSIYERLFTFIMTKCNETLFDPTMKKVQYIGVLRSLTTMALSKFVLILPMRSSNNFSTNTCLSWNKRSTSGKVLNGEMLTLAWTCKNASPCLRNP